MEAEQLLDHQQFEDKREQQKEKQNEEEQQYLDLLRRVQAEGVLKKNDRTGWGTRSLFGVTLRFSLKDGRYPLFTGRRLSFWNIFHEWRWMISGDTDAETLRKQQVKIWNDNTSRATLDRLGHADWQEGWLGKGYGYQWRHWNAAPHVPYALALSQQSAPSGFEKIGVVENGGGGKDSNDIRGASGPVGENINSNAGGLDQLAQLIRNLVRDPFSRRHIITAWNPSDLSEMALPPCHCWMQFFVVPLEEEKEEKTQEKEEKRQGKKKGLVCQMTQRSGDLVLGVPYNVASYALMTKAVAAVLNMEPLELIVTIGDAHVYQEASHVDAVRLLLEEERRRPKPFPTLSLRLFSDDKEGEKEKAQEKEEEKEEALARLLRLEWADCVLDGYVGIPPNMKINMAV